MIKEICPTCGLSYAPAKGHQCPKGDDKPKIPWKDRKAAYLSKYQREYMRKKRSNEKARHERTRSEKFAMKAEELRTVAEEMKNPDSRLRMMRLADSYDLLAECPICQEPKRKGGAA